MSLHYLVFFNFFWLVLAGKAMESIECDFYISHFVQCVKLDSCVSHSDLPAINK